MCFFEKLLSKTCKITHNLSSLVPTDFEFSKVKESKPTTITVMTKYNCPMDIVVTKRVYLMERKHAGFFRKKKKTFVIYQVTGIVPECFPDRMSKVMNSTLQIPSLLSRFYSEEKQINAVVSAFLDIKMANILKENQK